MELELSQVQISTLLMGMLLSLTHTTFSLLSQENEDNLYGHTTDILRITRPMKSRLGSKHTKVNRIDSDDYSDSSIVVPD